MPALIQKDKDGNAVKHWPLSKQPVAIGRGEQADIRIDDEQMSRRHFSVQWRDDHYAISDHSSTNGTWVNGQRIRDAELKPNDRIRAGRSLFAFESGLNTMISEISDDGTSYKNLMQQFSDEAAKGSSPERR